jgi:hypothetical protein
MKLSLEALRTRQRLRIRVPASPLSFVNALQTCSFGTWVHFRKVRRQPLLPIREGLLVTLAKSEASSAAPKKLDASRVHLGRSTTDPTPAYK